MVCAKRVSLVTGQQHLISGGLLRLLADTLVLLYKARHLSWRATDGPGTDIRAVVRQDHRALDAAADRIAGRILALGGDLPPNYAELVQGSSIKQELEPRSELAMIAQIADDHAQILADVDTLEAMLPLDADAESAALLGHLAACHRRCQASLNGLARRAGGWPLH